MLKPYLGILRKHKLTVGIKSRTLPPLCCNQSLALSISPFSWRSSSFVCRRSSVVCRSSSIVCRSSSFDCRSSSVVCRSSTFVCRSSSVVCRSSSFAIRFSSGTNSAYNHVTKTADPRRHRNLISTNAIFSRQVTYT